MPTKSKLSNLPGRSHTIRYAWLDQVLDGAVWELNEGEDFQEGKANSVRSLLSKTAKDRGLIAHTRTDNGTVYVQAVPRS